MPALPLNVGANRVVKGSRIEHVCGNPALPPDRDHELAREIVLAALRAVQTAVSGPTLFEPAVEPAIA